MKNKAMIYTLVLMASFPVFAEDTKLLKSCSTIISIPGEEKKSEMQINIVKKKDKPVALITQKVDGFSATREDIVEISELKVREGITAKSDPDKLNLAERLVTHALMMGEDPIFQGAFNAGFDLTKVRSATVYAVGEQTRFGLTAIVEAKDEAGNILGSYLGGFLVTPCDAPKSLERNEVKAKKDFSSCTKDLADEVSCPEGVYRFVGGRSGDKMQDSLKRNSKERSIQKNIEGKPTATNISK